MNIKKILNRKSYCSMLECRRQMKALRGGRQKRGNGELQARLLYRLRIYIRFTVWETAMCALDGVNLEIYKGELCSIVGTSGPVSQRF